MATISSVGVVGAGTMGNGIAHVSARSGLRVVLFDLEKRFLDRALSAISGNMDREIAKGKLTEEQKVEALNRITPATNPDALADVDFLIEAVNEDFETKSSVFKEADRITRPDIVLASNTSSISITKLASTTNRPGGLWGCTL